MSELISTENMEQILTRIDTLANKLGVTAEYLFGIYVKQAYIVLINNVLWYFLAFTMFVSFGVWLKYNLKHLTVQNLNGNNPMRARACIIIIVLILITTL